MKLTLTTTLPPLGLAPHPRLTLAAKKIKLNYCQAQHKLQLSWAELALFSLLDPTEPTRTDPNRNSFKLLKILFIGV